MPELLEELPARARKGGHMALITLTLPTLSTLQPNLPTLQPWNSRTSHLASFSWVMFGTAMPTLVVPTRAVPMVLV